MTDGIGRSLELTRRSFIQSAGVVAGGSGLVGTALANLGGPTNEYTLVGQNGQWIGRYPPEISGAVNPTLEIVAGQRLEITTEKYEDRPYQFAFLDEQGNRRVVLSELPRNYNATSAMTFTAPLWLAGYECTFNPDTAGGDVERLLGAGPRSLLRAVDRTTDTSHLTAGATARHDLHVSSREPVVVREFVPREFELLDVVADATVDTFAGTVIYFGMEGGLTELDARYYTKAPEDPGESGMYEFGPLEVTTDVDEPFSDEGTWLPVYDSTDEVAVIGAGI